jgi:hypothetical protein
MRGTRWGFRIQNMNEDISQWNQRAWSLIEDLSLPATELLRETWLSTSARQKPVVTLFGAYDTGKSSLLKRLLLDQSKPVPAWLTISARRETFECNEMELLGVVMVDTPGVSGGNLVHESVTDAALLGTDAVIVVLPPQLVTGDAEAVAAVMDVLSGAKFNCAADAAYPDGGLIIVLARMDEAGAMPDIDPEAYATLLQRKRQELEALLSKHGVSDERIIVHCVVADWSGMAGSAGDVSAADYDGSREWDGIRDLADRIGLLPSRFSELRLWSEQRFLRHHLGRAAATMQLQAQELRLAVESAQNEVESLKLQSSRLGALIGNAKASLEHRVAEEVRLICQRQDANPNAIKHLLNERLQGALERWYEANDAAVQALVDEFDTEIEERHQRPDWQAMAQRIASDTEATSQHAHSQSTGHNIPRPGDLQKGAKLLRTTIAEGAPLVIDMPLKKAREELARFKQAGSFQSYAKQAARRKGTFQSASHAKRAESMVKVYQVVTATVPVIIEIVGMVGEYQAETRAAEARIKERAALEQQLEKAGKAIIDDVWRSWYEGGIAKESSSALDELLTAASSRADLLKKQAGDVGDAHSRIKHLF